MAMKPIEVLADLLAGSPLEYPCDLMFEPGGGWCRGHCKWEMPSRECWLRYADEISMKGERHDNH